MGTLRNTMFPTKNRERTKFICIRDTLTRPADVPTLTLRKLDDIHCLRGKFSLGYHFVIFPDGTTEEGRDIDTIGNHSRNFDAISVGIGVVGGLDEEGKRSYTRTIEQEQSIKALIAKLQEVYPEAEINDQYLNRM